jgi:DNA polymerase III delta subunit
VANGRVGPDAGRLKHEATKLVLYAAPRREITRDDVAEVTGQSREFAVEGLIEAQLGRDLPRAVHVVDSLPTNASGKVLKFALRT